MTPQSFFTEFMSKTSQLSWGIKNSLPLKRLERIINKLENIERSEEQREVDEMKLYTFLNNWEEPRSSIDFRRIKLVSQLIQDFEQKYQLVYVPSVILPIVSMCSLLYISRKSGYEIVFIVFFLIYLVFSMRFFFISNAKKY